MHTSSILLSIHRELDHRHGLALRRGWIVFIIQSIPYICIAMYLYNTRISITQHIYSICKILHTYHIYVGIICTTHIHKACSATHIHISISIYTEEVCFDKNMFAYTHTLDRKYTFDCTVPSQKKKKRNWRWWWWFPTMGILPWYAVRVVFIHTIASLLCACVRIEWKTMTTSTTTTTNSPIPTCTRI